MGKLIDLKGRRFGKLMVVERAPNIVDKNGNITAMWLCKCDCGNKSIVRSELLRNGKTQSCGCLKSRPTWNFKDLSGQRFGKLTVISRANNKHNRVAWSCKCDCGNVVSVTENALMSRNTSSCGCLKNEVLVSRVKKHGLYRSRIRNIWRLMISRCENPSCDGFQNYGGRGIKVCEEWHNLPDFAKWAYSTGYREDGDRRLQTIERIDVNGNYCPENCCWVSMKKQCNNKRTNHYITCGNVTHTLQEWADILKIPRDKLRWKLEKGDSINDLLEKNKIMQL